MKLQVLHEAFTTGAIAFRPAALGGDKEPRRSEKDRWYFKFSRTPKTILGEGKYGTDSRQPKTSVWQFTKGGAKKKRWWDHYADTNNPDERLLKAFRGKGY